MTIENEKTQRKPGPLNHGGMLKVKAIQVTFPITAEITWECPHCGARGTHAYPLRDMFDNHSKIVAKCWNCEKSVVVRLAGISTELKKEKRG